MSEANKLEVFSLDEWDRLELKRRERIKPENLESFDNSIQDKLKKIKELQDKFPHFEVLAGHHHQHDLACRWLFENVGCRDGPCWEYSSEFPGCPLVLATRQQKDGWSEYKDPGRHEHEGVWQGFYLGKTGYDYGPKIYFFKNETDKAKFLVFTLSEQNFDEYYTKEFNNDAGF
jgi:hypothetical protein